MSKINDIVSNEFIDSLTKKNNDLLYCNNIYIQTNTPQTTVITDYGLCEYTFDTYLNTDGHWRYCGQCFAGEFFDSKKFLIDFNFEIRNGDNDIVEYYMGFESLADAFIYCKQQNTPNNLQIYVHPIDEYNNYKIFNSINFNKGLLLYDNEKNKVLVDENSLDALNGTLYEEVVARIEHYNKSFSKEGISYLNELSNDYHISSSSELINKRYEKLVNTEVTIDEYLTVIGLFNENNISNLNDLALYLEKKDLYLDNYTTKSGSLLIQNKIPAIKVVEEITENSYQNVKLFEIPNSSITKALDISNKQIYYEVAKILVESNGYFYDEEQITDLQVAISNDVRNGNTSQLYSEIEDIVINNPSIDDYSRKTLVNFVDEHITTMDNRKDKSYLAKKTSETITSNKNALKINLL